MPDPEELARALRALQGLGRPATASDLRDLKGSHTLSQQVFSQLGRLGYIGKPVGGSESTRIVTDLGRAWLDSEATGPRQASQQDRSASTRSRGEDRPSDLGDLMLSLRSVADATPDDAIAASPQRGISELAQDLLNEGGSRGRVVGDIEAIVREYATQSILHRWALKPVIQEAAWVRSAIENVLPKAMGGLANLSSSQGDWSNRALMTGDLVLRALDEYARSAGSKWARALVEVAGKPQQKQKIGAAILKRIIVYGIERGQLPVVHVDGLLLNAGESACWAGAAIVTEERFVGYDSSGRSSSQGASRSSSITIFGAGRVSGGGFVGGAARSGGTTRWGESRHQSSTRAVRRNEAVSTGVLALTNKRVIYAGSARTLSVPWKSVLSINFDDSGALVSTTKQNRPTRFVIRDFDRELAQRIAARLSQEAGSG